MRMIAHAERDALPDRAVCAIAVTYHPDRGFAERIERILPQVGALVIVDNGSAAAELEALRELAARPRITLIENPRNLGVARALNIGIERAAALSFAWVLLLDQDSRAEADMVEALFEAYDSHPCRDRVAVVGAGFLDVNRPASESPAGPDPGAEAVHGDSWQEALTVITSGSLIPLKVHAAVGPFRDELFIDYVDSDYCLRARAKGFLVIKTRRPLMAHAIGAWSRHQVLGSCKWTSNHSADRRYYIARNDTVMLREHGRYALGLWALKSLSRRFRQCKRIVLYENEKRPKLAAVIQGYLDGVRGRLGPRRSA